MYKSGRNQHWIINRPTNPYFTGRTEVITEITNSIRRALEDDSRLEQHRVVITGMGGQGKSEVCLHVANQVRSL